VIITDTIPLQDKQQRACPKIHQLSVAPLLGEAIRRIHADESVSSLFA
jgi:ribose-phosphate pyrophosphokinase